MQALGRDTRTVKRQIAGTIAITQATLPWLHDNSIVHQQLEYHLPKIITQLEYDHQFGLQFLACVVEHVKRCFGH